MADSEQERTYEFEGFCLDAQRRTLSRAGGEPIPMAPKVFDALLHLVEHSGELLGKRELMEAVWPDVVVEENNLNQAISTLRRVLGEAPGEHRFVVTEPGRGYRFVASVQRAEPRSRKPFDFSAIRTQLRAAAGPAALILLGVLAGGFLTNRSTSTAIGPELYPVGPPVTGNLPGGPDGNRMVAVSSDGTHLAYDFDNAVWLQTLGQQDAHTIAKGRGVFFSSDGEWVAFVSQGSSLMKTSVRGHASLAVTQLHDYFLGGSWVDEQIVFATVSGVYRVPANLEGAEAELLLAATENETYAWPELLPGGRTAVLTVISGTSFADANLVTLDLESGQLGATLLRGAVGARYIPSSDGTTGHLVYAADPGGHLRVRDFDPRSSAVSAVSAVSPEIAVRIQGTYLAAAFDATDSGSIVYVGPMAQPQWQFAWVDHEGVEELIAATLPPGRAAYPRISPDGTRVAFDAGGGSGLRRIWMMDFDRRAPMRFTDLGDQAYGDLHAVWSRDGKDVFFGSRRLRPGSIFSRAADGSGEDELVLNDAASQTPADLVPIEMGPDDRLLAYRGYRNNEEADIVVVDAHDPRIIEPLIASPYFEKTPVLSPDDHWMAYASNEIGGRFEVFVVAFPSGQFKKRISKYGGNNPVWGLDGTNELYFTGYTEQGDAAMMAATVSMTSEFRVVGERELFRKPYIDEMVTPHQGLGAYDVSPRDGRFLFVVPADQTDGLHTEMIWHMRNWIGGR